MPRARRVLGLLTLAAAALSVPAVPASARADERIDYADGPTACRAFHAKNDKELADWSKTQPATPYRYPQDETILGAPWGPLTDGIGSTSDLLLASIVPHVGSQLRASAPAILISWPWSIPFGPAYTCSRHLGSFTVRDYKFHRAMVEPGVAAGKTGAAVFARLGYRFLYHPSDWVVGVGGGLGSTIDLAQKGEPQRISLSPEAVMQFGHCCDASYFTFAVRYDRYFAGTTLNGIGATLGYTFF